MSDTLGMYLPLIALARVIVAALFILLATRSKKIPFFKKRERINEEIIEEREMTDRAITSDKSVPLTQVKKAKEDLRILNLEREIVGFALTRLYEAEAEGKITEDDRAELLDKYKSEMKQLEKQINRNEMIVKLYELEGTQTELIQIFNKRLDEINKEIGNIRSSLELRPLNEASKNIVDEKPPSKPQTRPHPTAEVEEIESPPSKQPSKTEAEQKLEAIQEEVLKVLDRLEQIETEG